MSVENLSIMSGIQQGMNTTFSLLDRIDQKRLREQQAKRSEQLWQDGREDRQRLLEVVRPRQDSDYEYGVQRRGLLDGRQDQKWADNRNDRQYLETVTRPNAQKEQDYRVKRREVVDGRQDQQWADGRVDRQHNLGERAYQKGRRSILDERGDTKYQHYLDEQTYNKDRRGVLDGRKDQQWDDSREDRKENKVRDTWNFNRTKDTAVRQDFEYFRGEQERKKTEAQQYFQNAIILDQQGDSQGAQEAFEKGDKLSGGGFSYLASGGHKRFSNLARQVSTGQLKANDPAFIDEFKKFAGATMAFTGRDKNYSFGGLQKLPDGRYGVKLTPKVAGGQYDAFIENAASRFGVDANLVRAVIGQESAGDKDALSNKGAQGLMQLMPATGKEMAQKLGIKNFDPKDPEQNVLVGTAYLAQQLGKYKNTELALAAYNAGPGAVDKHKGIPPFKETQHYVPKIMKNYRKMQQGVPATTGGSKHKEDVIVAKSLEEWIGAVQQIDKSGDEFQRNPSIQRLAMRGLSRTGAALQKPKPKDGGKWKESKDGKTLINDVTGNEKPREGQAAEGKLTGLSVLMPDDPLAASIDKTSPNTSILEKAKRYRDAVGDGITGEQEDALEQIDSSARGLVRNEYVSEALNAWNAELQDGKVRYKPVGSDRVAHSVPINRDDIATWAAEASDAGMNLQNYIETRLQERYEPIAKRYAQQKQKAQHQLGGAWR